MPARPLIIGAMPSGDGRFAGVLLLVRALIDAAFSWAGVPKSGRPETDGEGKREGCAPKRGRRRAKGLGAGGEERESVVKGWIAGDKSRRG